MHCDSLNHSLTRSLTRSINYMCFQQIFKCDWLAYAMASNTVYYTKPMDFARHTRHWQVDWSTTYEMCQFELTFVSIICVPHHFATISYIVIYLWSKSIICIHKSIISVNFVHYLWDTHSIRNLLVLFNVSNYVQCRCIWHLTTFIDFN